MPDGQDREHLRGAAARSVNDVRDEEVVGRVASAEEQKLQEASVEVMKEREVRGRETTQAFLAQIAVVGTFLGAFSLLNDAAKAALVQSEWLLWAMVAAAVSFILSMSTYVLLPGKMPPLAQIERLQSFWNRRTAWRKRLLVGALLALAVALFFAARAFAEARDAVAVAPAASVSAKFTPAKETPSSLEATATWTGLDLGDYSIVCVTYPGGNVLGAAVGVSGNDGKLTTTLTVPIDADITGMVTATTVRLASAPQAGIEPRETCQSQDPPRVGQPTSTSIRVKNPSGLG